MTDDIQLDAHMTDAEKWAAAKETFTDTKLRLSRMEKEVMLVYQRLEIFEKMLQLVAKDMCSILEQANGQ